MAQLSAAAVEPVGWAAVADRFVVVDFRDFEELAVVAALVRKPWVNPSCFAIELVAVQTRLASSSAWQRKVGL